MPHRDSVRQDFARLHIGETYSFINSPQKQSPSPIVHVPKPQSSWMNRISGWVIKLLIKVGTYYRRFYNIPEGYRDLWLERLIIHELPFNLIVKFSGHPVQEAIATMTARAMGIPVPKIILYADLGLYKGGYILMTRIPGQTLMDSHDLYSEEELDAIMVEVAGCLQQIRRFASPYGSAVCGPDGGEIRTRAVSDGEWRRRENPDDFHDDVLLWPYFLKDDRPEEYAQVEKLKNKSYGVAFAHGDLHPGNIMVQDGRLSGIIDWGSAAWLPDYWDFVLPMTLWPDEWGWIVDLFYAMPGGESYEQERESHAAVAFLVGSSFG